MSGVGTVIRSIYLWVFGHYADARKRLANFWALKASVIQVDGVEVNWPQSYCGCTKHIKLFIISYIQQ